MLSTKEGYLQLSHMDVLIESPNHTSLVKDTSRSIKVLSIHPHFLALPENRRSASRPFALSFERDKMVIVQ